VSVIRVKYENVNYFFVTNHYDIHLSGLAKMNGKLYYFKIPKGYSWDKLLYKLPKMHLYPLSLKEKILFLTMKRMFEFCVSKSWSYPVKTQEPNNRPHWFQKILFNLYYKIFRRVFYFFMKGNKT